VPSSPPDPRDNPSPATRRYQPLRGVRVLDLGILIPPSLTSAKLVALGADVVKVEQRGQGDRIRRIPPYGPDGESPQHMAQNWGKRSIELDLREEHDRALCMELAAVADVIVENQLAGSWARLGLDFEGLRARRPELIICSITGFGQTGPMAALPSHGLNMDALADAVGLEERHGEPRLGWVMTSWGNELGSTYAALAVAAALLQARLTGEGAWIDLSCWDALVECHRTEIAMTYATSEPFCVHGYEHGPLYDTYAASDGVPVLFAALEPKFWKRFCDEIGRPDLASRHTGNDIDFGWDDGALRDELRPIFATATAEEWHRRFIAWDVPGGPVLQLPQVMELPHFEARQLVEGDIGSWPNILNAIRWHHTGERAGAGLSPPPALGADQQSVLDEWLGRSPSGGPGRA
jgi:crotonobetainyl-CoA:carnitine CoA-transferase CaiB-like acyl-CoA transferase